MHTRTYAFVVGELVAKKLTNFGAVLFAKNL